MNGINREECMLLLRQKCDEDYKKSTHKAYGMRKELWKVIGKRIMSGLDDDAEKSYTAEKSNWVIKNLSELEHPLDTLVEMEIGRSLKAVYSDVNTRIDRYIKSDMLIAALDGYIDDSDF